MQVQQHDHPASSNEHAAADRDQGSGEQHGEEKQEARAPEPRGGEQHNGSDQEHESAQSGRQENGARRGEAEMDWLSVDATGDDSDVYLHLPRLTVDELHLELETSVGLDRILLDTKSLETGVLVRARLDNLMAVLKRTVDRGPEIVQGVASSGGGELGRSAPALGAGDDEAGGERSDDEQGPSASQEENGREQEEAPSSGGSESAAREEEEASSSGGSDTAAREEDETLREDMRKSYESARAALAQISDTRLNEELREAYESARAAYQRLASGESTPNRQEESDMREKSDRREGGASGSGRAMAVSVAKTVPTAAAGLVGGLILSRVTGGRRRGVLGRLPVSSPSLPGRSRSAKRVVKRVRRALP